MLLNFKKERNIKKAIITGPTGAIGIALCKYLLSQNITVYAVCNPKSQRIYRLPKSNKLKLILCDISKYKDLSNLISDKLDVFFHLAWEKTTGTERNDMQGQIKNIDYAIEAVKVAVKMGCKIFIGTGSQAEYGKVNGALQPNTPCFPENGYGMAKLCAGQMTRVESQQLGIEHIWVRILSVYGPGDGNKSMITQTIKTLLENRKPSLTEGKQIWDYIYSDDAAKAIYLAAKYGRNSAIYVLGSGKSYPLKYYIEELKNAINPMLPLGFGEIPYSDQSLMNLQANINSITQDTGFTPKIEFKDGIRKTIEWIKNDKK